MMRQSLPYRIGDIDHASHVECEGTGYTVVSQLEWDACWNLMDPKDRERDTDSPLAKKDFPVFRCHGYNLVIDKYRDTVRFSREYCGAQTL